MLATTAHGEIFNDRHFNPYSKYITYDNKGLVYRPANRKTFAMRKMRLNAFNLSGDGNAHFEIITEDIYKQFVHDIGDTNKNDFDINHIIRKSLIIAKR